MWIHCFFFNDTATTEIYTLSLHDALPISPGRPTPRRPRPLCPSRRPARSRGHPGRRLPGRGRDRSRSEEHTSELQSRQYLVCRLLLEKKKITTTPHSSTSTDERQQLQCKS